VCSASSDKLQSLITQLDNIYTNLQADTVSGGAPAFAWVNDDRKYFPGQIWTCLGFQNTAKFKMAEMCAAINRGLCDLSSLGALSADEFATWTQTTCGSSQNQQPAKAWFIEGNVYNPYAYWLRRTLQGTAYSFSQDEGQHGGNSNCNNINPTTSRPPDSSRVTVCPGSGPTPTPPDDDDAWKPCTSTNTPCCNPHTTPKQICPGDAKLACQECGGADACQCPSGAVSQAAPTASSDFPVWAMVLVALLTVAGSVSAFLFRRHLKIQEAINNGVV
jgi:hypothetical protein